MIKAPASVAAAAVAALVLLQGCGGGGLDFANLEGHLVVNPAVYASFVMAYTP